MCAIDTAPSLKGRSVRLLCDDIIVTNNWSEDTAFGCVLGTSIIGKNREGP